MRFLQNETFTSGGGDGVFSSPLQAVRRKIAAPTVSILTDAKIYSLLNRSHYYYIIFTIAGLICVVPNSARSCVAKFYLLLYELIANFVRLCPIFFLASMIAL